MSSILNKTRRHSLAWVSGGGGCTPYSQIDGAVSNNATFLHPADSIIAWTQAEPSNYQNIIFRRVDANNYWYMQIYPTQQYLRSMVAGVDGVFASSSHVTVAGGERLAVELNGTTIRFYVDGVLKLTRANCTDFATATDGGYVIDGTGNISDLKTWQLACRSSEGL